jgi:hypothetical protein
MIVGQAQFTVLQVAQVTRNVTPVTVGQRPIQNVADLLRRDEDQTTSSANGAPTQASPTGQNTNATLASVLNPAINLSPSSSLEVTDFVNVSEKAFPTAAKTAPTEASYESVQTPDNNNNTTGNPAGQFSPATTSFQSTPTQTGIYNAIGNANAPTVGGSVDTTA